MTKKTYMVIKAIKHDGVELNPGDDIGLEPGQAAKLLGTFVDEKTTPSTIVPASPAVSTAPPTPPLKSGRTRDGL